MMKCPKCGSQKTKVYDTRVRKKIPGVYRRRVCTKCKHRFTTREQYDG